MYTTLSLLMKISLAEEECRRKEVYAFLGVYHIAVGVK